MPNFWDKRHENVTNGSLKKTKRQILFLNVKAIFLISRDNFSLLEL